MISPRDNPKLKTVRKLASTRQRDKLGLFVAEGEDLVAAALEGGWELEFALADAARVAGLPGPDEPGVSQLLRAARLAPARRGLDARARAAGARRLPPGPTAAGAADARARALARRRPRQ